MHRLWKTDVKKSGPIPGTGYHSGFEGMPNGGILNFPQ